MLSIIDPQSTGILVLGMHRSGTSVMTRVVNLLGAELGSNFLPPAADNPTGFWEHLGAYEIHERLLTALGRNWYDMTEMPEDWLDHPATLQAQNELEELIRIEFIGSRLWAVKDPRMCRLAPLWLRATSNLGVRTKAIIVLRDPREVAESLRSRDGWLHGHSYVMWAQHLREAEVATRDICRTVISYESLMHDWQSCMETTAERLDVKWPVDPMTITSRIGAYINPAIHRHHSATRLESNLALPNPPGLVTEFYRLGCEVQTGKANWDSFLSVEHQYEAARDIFALAIAEQTAIAAKHVADIHVWRDEAEACGLRLKEAVNQGKELQTVVDQAQAHIVQLKECVISLGSQIERVQSEATSLQQELTERETIVFQTENAKNALEMRLETLEEHHLEVQAALELLKTRTQSRKWLLRRLLGAT